MRIDVEILTNVRALQLLILVFIRGITKSPFDETWISAVFLHYERYFRHLTGVACSSRALRNGQTSKNFKAQQRIWIRSTCMSKRRQVQGESYPDPSCELLASLHAATSSMLDESLLFDISQI